MNPKKHMIYRWAWKKLREWLKTNCLDIETRRLGDLKYCLEKYFSVIGRKKPNKKATLILFKIYNDSGSPIYKGIVTNGLTLARKSKKKIKSEYEAYIISPKWKSFKSTIIKERGLICERCKTKKDKLDLHHKTYARLFNELPSDVVLLCRTCHQNEHNKKF